MKNATPNKNGGCICSVNTCRLTMSRLIICYLTISLIFLLSLTSISQIFPLSHILWRYVTFALQQILS